MASVIDLSLLGTIRPIIVFLLVLTLAYGIFNWSKLFGDNKVLQGFLAFLLAVVASTVPAFVAMVEFMTPWFVILFIFTLFMLITFRIFGATDANFHEVIRKSSAVQVIYISIIIVIGIGALTAAFGAQAAGLTGEDAADGGFFAGKVAPVFFHPKVLGMVFLLLIATVSIRLLSSRMVPDWP